MQSKIWHNVSSGPSSSITCSSLRGADGASENVIVVTEEALVEVGRDLQFFVNCSQPGDAILFATQTIQPKSTTLVEHSLTFDVTNPGLSKVEIKCPSSEGIFDIQ